MHFIDTRDFQIKEPTVVTIGKFDGRHKGHQKLIGEMKKLKQEHGLSMAMFTFSLAPGAFAQSKSRPTVITTNQERRNNMEKMGIDYLVEYPFDENTSHMPPEEFVAKILAGQMNAKAIVAGPDCGFGYQRSGDVTLLKNLEKKYGYQLKVVEKAQDEYRDISSSYIREELDKGNIKKANELLGEPYAIHGTVVHGNHIGGSILGFPTANIIPPPQKHLPPYGVYVSQVLVDGEVYGGITNIGKKPTIDGEYPVGVETYIFHLNQDLYGKAIEVRLLDFERRECKFNSLDQLKEQIEKDKEYGLRFLEEYGGIHH